MVGAATAFDAAAVAASRLIFFFFLALEDVAAAVPKPPLPLPPRAIEGIGERGVDGERKAPNERLLTAAAAAAAAAEGDADIGECTPPGRALALEGVRRAASAGWAMGVAVGVLRAKS